MYRLQPWKYSTTHLHDVVLADGTDDPGVVGVPAEVGDLGRVAAVDEQQLGRAVLGVLGALERKRNQIQNCRLIFWIVGKYISCRIKPHVWTMA